MNRTLPPFPAVRAFEAAARHLSFKRAAEELHVTQSAVSHQIKALEDFLGVALFRRGTRGVALTAAGRSYLPALGEALDKMASATERLRGDPARDTLSVKTTPAFASRWLLPRLDAFRRAHPSITIALSTAIDGVDFANEDIDVAVWYGYGDWPRLHSDSLLRSRLVPVCSPGLLRDGPVLRRPDDLRHYTLLHNAMSDDWARWLRAAGAGLVDATRGPRFGDCNLMMQAAVEGQGVALAFEALVDADLAAGRLVEVFDVELLPDAWYYILVPPGGQARPKVAAFRDWLLHEAAGEERAAPPRRGRPIDGLSAGAGARPGGAVSDSQAPRPPEPMSRLPRSQP